MERDAAIARLVAYAQRTGLIEESERVWAVNTLLSGKGNRVVGTQDGHIVDMDMEEALVKTKSFQMDRYQVLEALTNNGGSRY